MPNFEDPLDCLKKYFRKDRFIDKQEEVITAILEGRDVMTVMPTGSGKSLCYQLPAVMLEGVTVVVSPLIALMQDQVDKLNKLGIHTAYINSELDGKTRNKIMRDATSNDKKKNYKLLYVSPERLMKPKFIRFAQKLDISMITVDEAHCVSLWGYDFRADYLKIARFITMLDKRPIITAFTATATEFIKEDIIRILRLNQPFIVSGGYERTNLTFSVKHRKNFQAKMMTLYAYMTKHFDQCGIIYCSTVENTENVYKHLKMKNYNVSKYHGDMEPEDKKENFDLFKSGKNNIMVATNAFGMGIDISNIRFVIHFDMPKDLENYYQEAGRAGRDRKQAECILYYSEDDIKICLSFLKNAALNSEFDKETSDFRYKLGLERLEYMKSYGKMEEESTSDELNRFTIDYFKNHRPLCSHDKEIQAEQIKIEERLKAIDVLYINTTKAANLIRKGNYEPCVPQIVKVGKNKFRELTVEFRIDRKLTYFDLMVADAVYTLETMKLQTIYPKKIMEVLSGDPDVTLKPDRKKEIEDSLEKMMNTYFRLDRSNGKYGFAFEDEKDINIFEGPFLPLMKWGKNGYRYSETPPLYRYAELTNGQFFTIPLKRLCVKSQNDVQKPKKIMPDSIENLELKFYLAWHIILSDPKRTYYRKNRSSMSRMIKFENDDSRRADMLDILDIDIPEDKYLKKRKKSTLYEKVKTILDYHMSIGVISSYVFEVNGKLAENETKITGKETGVLVHYPMFKTP